MLSSLDLNLRHRNLWPGGVAAAVGPQLSSTLTENYNDNSRNTGLWNVGALKTSGAGSVTVNETNQRLEIAPNVSLAGYSGYISAASWILDSFAQKLTVVGTSGPVDEAYIGAGQDSSNYYLALVGNGNLFLQRNVGGAAANVGSVAYNAANHAWLRLRYNGTTIFLDVAPSTASNPPIAGDWTNLFSEVANVAITLSSCKLASVGGASGAGATATYQFDGLNTAT